MRIGMMIGEGAGESPTMDEVIRRAQRAEEVGLDSGWLAHIFHTMPLICSPWSVGRPHVLNWERRSYRPIRATPW